MREVIVKEGMGVYKRKELSTHPLFLCYQKIDIFHTIFMILCGILYLAWFILKQCSSLIQLSHIPYILVYELY